MFKFGFVLFIFASPALSQELFVDRYRITIQQDRQTFFEKTAQEAQTPEGQAIIGSVSAYLGIPPKYIAVGVAGVSSLTSDQRSDEEFSGLIQSAPGYTICFAATSCVGQACGLGAGEHGIETHGDSTFNGTVTRVIPGQWSYDGLGWYLFAPISVTKDSRVDAIFDVGVVKAEGNWMETFNCQPNGFHPWLARNNVTTLNKPCEPSEGAWCGQ
jgi:hypothetical protein